MLPPRGTARNILAGRSQNQHSQRKQRLPSMKKRPRLCSTTIIRLPLPKEENRVTRQTSPCVNKSTTIGVTQSRTDNIASNLQPRLHEYIGILRTGAIGSSGHSRCRGRRNFMVTPPPVREAAEDIRLAAILD